MPKVPSSLLQEIDSLLQELDWVFTQRTCAIGLYPQRDAPNGENDVLGCRRHISSKNAGEG
jgi:hypothetical protein